MNQAKFWVRQLATGIGESYIPLVDVTSISTQEGCLVCYGSDHEIVRIFSPVMWSEVGLMKHYSLSDEEDFEEA